MNSKILKNEVETNIFMHITEIIKNERAVKNVIGIYFKKNALSYIIYY